jgi:hypothetical protein
VTRNALIDYVQRRRRDTRAPHWLEAIAAGNEQFADELAD